MRAATTYFPPHEHSLLSNAIVLIAPVAPFRGGIARHSTALANAFARRQDVRIHVESFSRLYPRLLYPGTDDRDPNATVPSDIPVHYAIDSINPVTWRHAVRRIAARHPALVVIPAWTFFVAPALGFIARKLRQLGIPVTMVVHNVSDHDGARWKSALSDWQLRQADRYVTHGDALAKRLQTVVGARPIDICPHPPYSDYPEANGTMAREYALELLCFGLVRPYKGVDIAIEALAKSGRRDIRLTVAGEAWQDLASLRKLAEDGGIAEQVEFLPYYVSDETTAELFARSDAVLAPYRTVTGSGVLALARHYRRPLIASDLPGFSEHIDNGRNGWLFPACDTDALAELLAATVTRDRTEAMAAAAPVHDDGREWDSFAAVILDGSCPEPAR